MEELLQLARENNQMLKRICAWLDKKESPEYQMNEDMKQFAINLSANAVDKALTRNQNNNQQTFWR